MENKQIKDKLLLSSCNLLGEFTCIWSGRNVKVIYSSRQLINHHVFLSLFQRGTTSTTSCFGSLGDEAFPNRGLLLKSMLQEEKAFPLRLDPH